MFVKKMKSIKTKFKNVTCDLVPIRKYDFEMPLFAIWLETTLTAIVPYKLGVPTVCARLP